MTPVSLVFGGVVLIGLGIGVGQYLRRRHREDTIYIAAPDFSRFPKLPALEVEAIRKRADLRRAHVDERTRERAQIASGQATPDRIIRLIGKRG